MTAPDPMIAILSSRKMEQTGWLRTLSEPIRYAGINPGIGETDLHTPEQVEIDRFLAGLSNDEGLSNQIDRATMSNDSHRSLWRLLAWIIIVLVIVESFVVNRMKK